MSKTIRRSVCCKADVEMLFREEADPWITCTKCNKLCDTEPVEYFTLEEVKRMQEEGWISVDKIMEVVKDWDEYDTRIEHGSAGENEYLDIMGFYLFWSDLRARLTKLLSPPAPPVLPAPTHDGHGSSSDH